MRAAFVSDIVCPWDCTRSGSRVNLIITCDQGSAMWVIFVHDGRKGRGYSVRSHVKRSQTIDRAFRNERPRLSVAMTLVRSVPRPPGFYVTTQDSDTLSTIAARYGVEAERIWELNNRARQLEFKRGRFPFHFWARQSVADTPTTRGLTLEEALGRPLVPGQRVFVPNKSAVQQAKVAKQHESRLRLAQPSASKSAIRSETAKVGAAPAGTVSVQVAGRPRALDGSNTMSAQPLKGMTAPAPMPAHPGSVVGTVGSADFFLGVFAVLIGFYSARLMLPRPAPEPGSPARPSISVILHKRLVGLVQASLTVTVLIGLALSALFERLRAVLMLALRVSTTLVRGLLRALRVVGSAFLLIWGGTTLIIGAFLGLFQRLAQALVYSIASILLFAWRSAVGLWSAASSRSAAVLEGLAKNRMFLAASGMESPSQAVDAPSSVSSSVSQTESLFAQLCRFFHSPSDGDYVRCVLRERIQISDAYIRMRFDLPSPDDELALLMGQRLEMRVRKSRQSLWSDIHSSSESVSAVASSDIRPHRLAIATDRHQRGSFDIIVPVSRALQEVLQEATGIDAARSDSASSWMTNEHASSRDISGDLRVLEKPQTPNQVMPTNATTDAEFDEAFLVALESLVEGHDTVLVRPAPDTELVYRRAMNPSAKAVVVHNVALLASGMGIVSAARIAEELLSDPESAVSRITLIYYNERAQDFIMLDDLDRMTKAFGEHFRLHCVWNDNTGQYPSRPGMVNNNWASTRVAAATKVMPAMPAWTEGTMAIICGNETFSRDMWYALCDSGYPEDAITLA